MVDVKNKWKNVLIKSNVSVINAIKHMDKEGLRVLLVVDDMMHLHGIVTDGDIRRYLLNQSSLEASVENLMNKAPVTAGVSDTPSQLLAKMHALSILHLPIVDDHNRVIGLETFETLYAKKTRDNPVIFMAGGLGKRLYPLTADCPKPLLKVGDKPISEILLDNFIKCGFTNFYFSVNYKAEMIREYYGNGSRWSVNIDYIVENDALGTAGSLSLLPNKPEQPFIVINADILTNINFGHILDFHYERSNSPHATLCVREHQNTIPFGVVKINENNHTLVDIEEKPTRNYFVNAGIYVLDPALLGYLDFNKYCDMPQFLSGLTKNGIDVLTFPIREYWLDIGHHDNLVRAASDYSEIFS